MNRALVYATAAFALAFSIAPSANAADAGADAGEFAYDPPGQLVDGSGKGRADDKVFVPDMRFPIESGPAFANSQVWGVGGNSGPAGSQCEERNFSYPWHDNYCETRSWDMPLCPSGTGHQGQDVRASSCEKGVHPVVAVADGTITNVGSYSVYLTTADGTRFDYLHMSNLTIKVGDTVKRGQRIGMVSNQFGGEVTTVHLHFNIRQNVEGVGQVYVPPYTSLIKAYKTLMGWDEPETKDAGTVDADLPKTEPSPVTPVTPKDEPPPPPTASEEESGCVLAPRTTTTGVPFAAVALGLSALAITRRKRKRF
ncbi:hypothetical protein AKJ09_10889 [Labilithrix luteola]|uniref:M23ase beta-sheet core domain-containing protein n=1 Tax=Labilithrix luteola TaxID=1391654 RepID=A0A0K1QEP4_9BACT|nr:M23 family metallopeptidase [Labilithrix luteola]AKV04226.1 hypothetical protein AKJ09_10889 [Labilithrix luteola]